MFIKVYVRLYPRFIFGFGHSFEPIFDSLGCYIALELRIHRRSILDVATRCDNYSAYSVNEVNWSTRRPH
jgi:hypothetical protein